MDLSIPAHINNHQRYNLVAFTSAVRRRSLTNYADNAPNKLGLIISKSLGNREHQEETK